MKENIVAKNIRLNINVPLEVRCELKKCAAERNISLKKYILRALLIQLKKDKEVYDKK